MESHSTASEPTEGFRDPTRLTNWTRGFLYASIASALVRLWSDAGNLLGTVMLRKLGDASAEIKRLFVNPDARGMGIGNKLISFLLGEAREIGYQQIFLDTGTYMPAAHRLYESFGFRDTGPYPGSENDETVQKFLRFMKLEL